MNDTLKWIGLIVLAAAGAASSLARADCVMQPNAPAVPAGCVAVTPDCVCDEQGQNCHWIFHCVK